MITRSDLRRTAREYLQSAEVLRANLKYDVSIYLCGYAVEIALKERICRTLKWRGYPATSGEFSNFRSFQTHNLQVLLELSAIENKVVTDLSGDWSVLVAWNPEQRYRTSVKGDTMSNTRGPMKTDDIIRVFQQAEAEISHERGSFTLFGLFQRLDIPSKYDCVVSAPWLNEELSSINIIFDLVHASIGHSRWFRNIGIFVVAPGNSPFVEAIREALPNGPIEHSFKRITNFYYDGEVIRDAVIITAMMDAERGVATNSRSAEPVAA